MSQSPARKTKRQPPGKRPVSAGNQTPRHVERPEGGAVFAWIDPGTNASAFTMSLAGLVAYDAATKRYLGEERGGGFIHLQSSPRIAEARTQVVRAFLTEPKFERADWLFMVDADMTFADDALERLVSTATTHDVTVVGGLCFAGGRTTVYPTLYGLSRDDAGRLSIDRVSDYEPGSVITVGATGAAALVVHRSLLVAMADAHPKGYGTRPDGGHNAFPWFVEGSTLADGTPIGEDIAFCIRVNALGHKVLVDTAVKFGHVKSVELTEELWLEGRARDGVPHDS